MQHIKRFLPLILFVAILFNSLSVFITRYTLRKEVLTKLNDITLESQKIMLDFSRNAMQQIDNYFLENNTKPANISSTLDNSHSSTNSIVAESPSSPILQSVDSVEYSFYRYANSPYARISGIDYTIGDSFPHGGVIQFIHPTCIILEGGFRVDNTDKKTKSLVQQSTNKGIKNDLRTNT